MEKRRKRKLVQTPAPYLRKPTHQRLVDTIDHQKYNLEDISGSESDTDIPIVQFSAQGSKYGISKSTDMHVDYRKSSVVHLNHSNSNGNMQNMNRHVIVAPKKSELRFDNFSIGVVRSSQGRFDQSKYPSSSDGLGQQIRSESSSFQRENFSRRISDKKRRSQSPKYSTTRYESPGKRNRSSSRTPEFSRSRHSPISPEQPSNQQIRNETSSSQRTKVSRRISDKMHRSKSPKYSTSRYYESPGKCHRSSSKSPEFSRSGHSPSSSEQLSNLSKYPPVPDKKEPDVANVLKSVVASVLNAPDVKSIISNIPAGESRDELLKGLIEEQLTQSVVRNPALLKQITQEGSQAVSSIQNGLRDSATEPDKADHNRLSNSKAHFSRPPHNDHPNADVVARISSELDTSKYVPLEPVPEQPKPSLLSTYIKNLFEAKEIKYSDEDNPEASIMLLIYYQAKYFLREGHERILPLIPTKKDMNKELYCGNCRQEFLSTADKSDHEKSYLHLIISGEWWNSHAQPPKYLPIFMVNNIRCDKIFIWCIICFEKHEVGTNEQLFQHLKSSHHQFNMHCWKECFNAWPLHEWCLWKDVESVKCSLPRSTVNGFDWPMKVKSCVIPDFKV